MEANKSIDIILLYNYLKLIIHFFYSFLRLPKIICCIFINKYSFFINLTSNKQKKVLIKIYNK